MKFWELFVAIFFYHNFDISQRKIITAMGISKALKKFSNYCMDTFKVLQPVILSITV